MKAILDLCGGTGSWSKPYREAGYYVYIVDPEAEIEPCFKGTVQDFFRSGNIYLKKWHGVLCAFPCDHFSYAGAQYFKQKDLDGRTANAIWILKTCLLIIDFVKPVFYALENPRGRAPQLVPELGEPVYTFDPWEFGDPYTKKTYLWGRFNPYMVTMPVKPERTCAAGSWVMKLGGNSKKTKRLRSITPPGFARAFFEANQ